MARRRIGVCVCVCVWGGGRLSSVHVPSLGPRVPARRMCLLANTSGGGAHANKSLICLPMKTKGVKVARTIKKLGMLCSDTAGRRCVCVCVCVCVLHARRCVCGRGSGCVHVATRAIRAQRCFSTTLGCRSPTGSGKRVSGSGTRCDSVFVCVCVFMSVYTCVCVVWLVWEGRSWRGGGVGGAELARRWCSVHRGQILVCADGAVSGGADDGVRV